VCAPTRQSHGATDDWNDPCRRTAREDRHPNSGIHGNEDIGGGQVPIGAGAKIVGRQSDYNIGVLDVETRDLPAASLRRQNLFAARVSRSIQA